MADTRLPRRPATRTAPSARTQCLWRPQTPSHRHLIPMAARRACMRLARAATGTCRGMSGWRSRVLTSYGRGSRRGFHSPRRAPPPPPPPHCRPPPPPPEQHQRLEWLRAASACPSSGWLGAQSTWRHRLPSAASRGRTRGLLAASRSQVTAFGAHTPAHSALTRSAAAQPSRQTLRRAAPSSSPFRQRSTRTGAALPAPRTHPRLGRRRTSRARVRRVPPRPTASIPLAAT